ncbi:hypothetical protein MIND_00791000 [Mycena indigotica]|uniref:Uncharacterized protein n=1 Tax=Mycena indigotica TaxID=2126181 RepID=A0A8H6SM12_9AGAR|nr:uncharacterized protein MIND_00791000 [Mycena indigotica]KAF7302240.1 hypothetical protein MIND_00791000 [Mycena indigotica]
MPPSMAASPNAPLRLRQHLTPSTTTITAYLVLVVVQYLIPDRGVDYSAPHAAAAYALITPFMYIALGHIAGRVVSPTIVKLLSLTGIMKEDPKPVMVTNDEEAAVAVEATPAAPRKVAGFLQSLIPTFIIAALNVPAAALLHISQRPQSASSWFMIVSGTISTLGRVMKNVFIYASLGLLALVAFSLAPILIMRHQARVVQTLTYMTLIGGILLAYSITLNTLWRLDLQAQSLQSLLAHFRWQAIYVISPAACWFGALVFFLETFYLFTTKTADYLFRRALVVEPSLFRVKDSYRPPSYFDRIWVFLQSIVLPAVLILSGLCLQERGEKLHRWGQVLAIVGSLSSGIFALDFGLYFFVVKNTAPSLSTANTSTLDRLALSAGVYLLTNRNGESFWTMLERLKQEDTARVIEREKNLEELEVGTEIEAKA